MIVMLVMIAISVMIMLMIVMIVKIVTIMMEQNQNNAMIPCIDVKPKCAKDPKDAHTDCIDLLQSIMTEVL